MINFIKEQEVRKIENISKVNAFFSPKTPLPLLKNVLFCIFLFLLIFDGIINILFFSKIIFLDKNILIVNNIIILSLLIIALFYLFWIIPIKTINAQIKKMNLNGEIVPISYNFLCPKAIKNFYSSYNSTLEKIECHKKENAILNIKTLTDELTGVSNYRGFCEFIKMRENFKSNDMFLIFCDLDNFKKINDTCGHSVGDKVLKLTASILSDVFDFYGNVFRYGGEEFAIIICNQDKRFVYSLAEEFRKKIKNSDEISKITQGVFASISIGISHLSENVSNTNDLLRYADIALYEAKANGKNCIIFYDEMAVK